MSEKSLLWTKLEKDIKDFESAMTEYCITHIPMGVEEILHHENDRALLKSLYRELNMLRPKQSEDQILKLTAELWNEFLKLPKQHPSEREDFSNAIHDIQKILALRVAREHRPDLFPKK